jgi:hypothetical protein
MRKMKQNNYGDIKGSEIPVLEWWMLKNSWEVYVSEIDGDQVFGLVCGFEDELGYSSMEELKPFIIYKAKGDDLNDLAPAPDWKWED